MSIYVANELRVIRVLNVASFQPLTIYIYICGMDKMAVQEQVLQLIVKNCQLFPIGDVKFHRYIYNSSCGIVKRLS